MKIFNGKPGILVIDEYQYESVDAPRMANLFTKHSHDCNVTRIFIVQSMCPKENMPEPCQPTRTNTYPFTTYKTRCPSRHFSNKSLLKSIITLSSYSRTVQIHVSRSTSNNASRSKDKIQYFARCRIYHGFTSEREIPKLIDKWIKKRSQTVATQYKKDRVY